MKRLLFIIMTLVALTSCSTVKYAGTGKGVSDDEQVATDKSFLAAGVEASRQNNVTFNEVMKKETVDNGGTTSTTFTSTQTAETETVFTGNSIRKQVRRSGDSYKVTTQFDGSAKKHKE